MTATLRRQGSQVRSERDEVARQAEERSDDEAAQPPSNPVGRAIYFRTDLERGLIGRVAKSIPHAVSKE